MAAASRSTKAMKVHMVGKKTAGKKLAKTVMKAKRVSKIATGRLAKALVLKGTREKTSGGLKKDSLMKNKRGKIVSKRAAAAGKIRFQNIEEWCKSVAEARKALHVEGFVAINGKSLQGKALYVKSKALREAKRGGSMAQASTAGESSPAEAAAASAEAAA
ncbi:Dinoflagellate/viral nucleoprotein (DVNP) [Amphidinium carterae]|mmetsp:Transcript_27122/g.62696  ORF Transcript_27122/g.62696 Transcript_27122/m.62696 type:complete len:161 (-) Transcript_27122:175-657(-)